MKKLLLSLVAISLTAAAGLFFYGGLAQQEMSEEEKHFASYEGRDGKAEALADIRDGKAKLLLTGERHAEFDEHATIMKERFQVALLPVADCVVPRPMASFVSSYNAEVEEYIARRFGRSALKDAQAEAFALWEAAHREKANQSPEPMPLKRHGSS